MRRAAAAALAVLAALGGGVPAARAADDAPEIAAGVNLSWYAMRDERDFGVVVATLDRGPLRLEARYNYELRHAASVFVGWTFEGGETLRWQARPILGALFAGSGAAIPGVEATLAYGPFDAYVEAEYVVSLERHPDSYFYAWSELAWRPVDRLRIGFVAQRTRVVDSERDIQRGIFGQLVLPHGTVSVYAFNPDGRSRYTVVSLALSY